MARGTNSFASYPSIPNVVTEWVSHLFLFSPIPSLLRHLTLLLSPSTTCSVKTLSSLRWGSFSPLMQRLQRSSKQLVQHLHRELHLNTLNRMTCTLMWTVRSCCTIIVQRSENWDHSNCFIMDFPLRFVFLGRRTFLFFGTSCLLGSVSNMYSPFPLLCSLDRLINSKFGDDNPNTLTTTTAGTQGAGGRLINHVCCSAKVALSQGCGEGGGDKKSQNTDHQPWTQIYHSADLVAIPVSTGVN